MKKIVLMLALTSLMVSCGSKDKKKELKEVDNSSTIQRDYIVRDASSNIRPAWVYEAKEWAQAKNRNVKKYRYFSFETEPKVNREIACNLASANAKANIAGEITTFISKTLGSSQEGQASIDQNNPDIQALRSFVENTLASKVQALITGAGVVKKYWEKRNYKLDLGAKKDYYGFTCAVLVRMDRARLTKAIDRAARILDKKSDDPKTKANVKNAIREAKENFSKIMTDSTIRG
jgi:hypothetical protein